MGEPSDLGFDLFFESNPNPMWFYERGSLRFLAVNDAAVSRYGYTADEFLRMTLREIRPAEDVPDLERVAVEAGAGMWVNPRVWRHRRKDGSILLAEIHLHSCRFRGADAMLVMALDVTGRVRAAEALAESEQRLQQLVGAIRQGLWLRDVGSGRFIYVSPACEQIYGVSAAEAMGEPTSFLRVVHPDDRAGVEALVRTVDAGPVETEYRICRPGGEIRWVAVRFHPVRDPTGKIVRIAGVSEDVTETRRLQAQLALAERLASMGTLAAGMAHEINNPLSYAMSNIEFAREEIGRRGGPGLEDASSALEDARDGVKRVRSIVRDLKSFSEGRDDETAVADVSRAARVAVNMVQNEIRHRAELVLELADGLLVQGSEGRLGQVVLNLLVNAAHAIPEGAAPRNTIRVCTRREGERVIVEVSDTGAGIAPEALPHIFEPFYTTKPAGEGSGLGLALCHGIVAAMGGRIEVESAVGRGTAFRLLLPVAHPGSPSKAPAKRAEPEPPVRRVRVLVVDDESAVRRAVERVLTGHDVVAVGSGREALERITRGERFDAILCDLMMPDMSGADLHDALARTASDQRDRLAFLTGGAFTENARRFLERSDRPVVEKPFEVNALRALVARLAYGS